MSISDQFEDVMWEIPHKRFLGSVHFSNEAGVFCGKIEGINNLVIFKGTTVLKLKMAFKEL